MKNKLQTLLKKLILWALGDEYPKVIIVREIHEVLPSGEEIITAPEYKESFPPHVDIRVPKIARR